MANEGKKFEEDFAKSIPVDVFKQRLKDDMSGFKGVGNICDYIIFRHPILYLFELKSHKGKSIPFTALREKQVNGLFNEVGKRGIRAGFVFNFRDLGETWFVNADLVMDFINHSGRKSFPIDWCREHGINITGEKVRTRYRYKLDSFLDDVNGGFNWTKKKEF